MIDTFDNYTVPSNVTIEGSYRDEFAEILTPEAIRFLKALHLMFNTERELLLEKRALRQEQINAGQLPEFPKSTVALREKDWTIDDVPEDLLDRRVEITGPVDRKMIINALNSGANTFMADFEDSNAPTWKNCIEGQINLRDAVNRTISFANPDTGKKYSLISEPATLLVRPRGWHLEEKHLKVFDKPMSASLFDFGLFFFHNAENLIKRGSGPYFYLPKLESHLEARLWNDVFLFAQDYMGIPRGTIKATVLIETILASFELDEILYELKEHSAGLNCGRWDYIFSYIKRLHKLGYVLPDRSKVGMTVPFMQAYTERVIAVCHRRGAHAMGGMAAQIPIKADHEANEKAIAKVREDKLREVKAGHDGTWVAHPGLVGLVKEIFDTYMPWPNQIQKQVDAASISEEDLLRLPEGVVTEVGVRLNINVGILYIESWLQGTGAAALYHLMEDAATAEISRTQLWQWIKAGTILDDGRVLDITLYESLRVEELEKIKQYVGSEYFNKGRFEEAEALFDKLIKSEELCEFLTLEAYDHL